MSHRLLARNLATTVQRRAAPKGRYLRGFTTFSSSTTVRKLERPAAYVLAGTVVTLTSVGLWNGSNFATTSLEALVTLPLGPTVFEETIVADETPAISTINKKDIFVEEPETGIAFPPVFESMNILGLGVRKKFNIVKVYAVGFYVNPEDFLGKNDCESRLLNPHHHRIIRIVMNRTLTMEVVMSALVDALKPRMHGNDMFALDEFSKMKQYDSLEKGDEIILTIHDESVECKCSNGGHTLVRSEVLTRAICDVYFGNNPISPAAKQSVIRGIQDLQET